MSEALKRLADLVGIASGYTDAFGQRVETAHETRCGMLAALGFAVRDDREVAASLAGVEQLRRGMIPPLLPAEARRSLRVPLLADATPGSVTWRVVDERGQAREGRAQVSMAASGPGIDLPPLVPGYHHLTGPFG